MMRTREANRCWPWWRSALAFGLLTATPGFSFAAVGQAELDAQSVLKAGWQSSVKAYDNAARVFAEASGASQSDVRVQYAMALVAIKHRRYAQALELVEQMLAAKPNVWTSQRAELWLLVVLRRNDQALEAMSKISEHLGDDQRLDPAERDNRARHLGRLYTFMEVASEKPLADEVLRKYETRVLEGLGVAAQLAFDEGRDSLMEAFQRRQSEQHETRAVVKEAQSKQLEQKTADLASEKDQTIEAAADIEQQAADLRDALNSDLGTIDNGINQRRAVLTDLQRQASIVLSRMNRVQIEIDRVQLLIDSTPPEDEFELGRLFAIMRSLEFDYAREASVYRPIAAQARGVEGELAGLAQQRQQTVARFENQMQALGKTYTNLERRSKRIDIDQKKVDRTNPTGVSPRVRANDAVLTALSTYEPFPVEEERQKVLASFRK